MPANLKIIQLLCLIPCVWAAIAHFGGLDKLENALLDLRFRHGKLNETLTEITEEIDRIKARPGANIDGRYQEFRSELATRKLGREFRSELTGPRGILWDPMES